MFCCVSYHLVHLGPFGCLTKLGAKRAKLVQKFGPRSRIGVLLDERTRSTPLDPKLMFWCVSYHLVHLGPFGCLTKLEAKRAERAKVRATKSRQNFSRRTHPINSIGPKLMFL